MQMKFGANFRKTPYFPVVLLDIAGAEPKPISNQPGLSQVRRINSGGHPGGAATI
jgi:hypothetical protein